MVAQPTQLNMFPTQAQPQPKRSPVKRATRLVVAARVQRGDLWALGKHHRLLCGDSTNAGDMARLMGGERAALVVADPPYGIGIDTWDKPLRDIPGWVGMIRQGMAANAFLALFQQMPTALEWLVALQAQGSGYRYRDHVAWVKRIATTPGAPLTRSHESLFIYSVGKPYYVVRKGRYSDVKAPGVLFDVATIQSIQTHIDALQKKVTTGYSSPINRTRGIPYRGYNGIPATGDRSPEFVNFTNVWSFLPEHRAHLPGAGERHATAKPTLLIERLVQLCTPDGAPVLDPFLGSGTTLIACEHTGRTCYGCEIDPGYCDTVLARWEAATGQRATLLSSEATA